MCDFSSFDKFIIADPFKLSHVRMEKLETIFTLGRD